MQYHAVISFLLLAAAAVPACTEEECSDVVRLSFATVRDGLPSDGSPLPAATGVPCDRDHVSVLCSDTGYPNDVFCDLGRLRFHPAWDSGDTRAVEVELTYKHPAVESYCTAKLTSSGGDLSTFAFVGAECLPAVEDRALPHFLVSDVRVLKVRATSPPGGGARARRSTTPGGPLPSTTAGYGDRHGDECFNKVYNFGSARRHGAAKGGSSRSRRFVKFALTNFFCQSASTTLVGGRPPQKTFFSHTGRRYRPTGK